MRADARRNRDRLIGAATELILEVGGTPPRDAIARRAGVGIGTLYRHFPGQHDLLRAVTLDVLDRTIAAGEQALVDADGDGSAVGRYLHATIDIGLGVVNIVHPLLDDTDWPDRTTAAGDVLQRVLADAHAAETVGGDVTAADITHAAIRFARPLAIGLAPASESEIAHRQLDVYLEGLAAAVTRG